MLRAPLLAVVAACAATAARPRPTSMQDLYEPYVKLVLTVGVHDPSYVDAYYGPEAWRAEVDRSRPGLAQIRADAEALRDRVRAAPAPADELDRVHQRL